MTHRDGFPRLSARSAWRSDAGHRQPCAPSQSYGPSESLGKPPFRSRRRTGSGRTGGRRIALPMSRIARGFPPTRPLARRIACAISMGHYQRSLVLGSLVRPRSGSPASWLPSAPCPNTSVIWAALARRASGPHPGAIPRAISKPLQPRGARAERGLASLLALEQRWREAIKLGLRPQRPCNGPGQVPKISPETGAGFASQC